MLGMGDHIQRCMSYAFFRGMIPLNFMFPFMLGFCVTPEDRRYKRNSNRLRAKLAWIIEQRQKGVTTVYGGEDADLLDILLKDDFYKARPNYIIDEVL